jgi:uncharacterized membrane protein HdeD (DUF308 family)
MSELAREASQFSTSLVARGVLLVFLGMTAISWPDELLVGAMFTGAACLVLFGAFEIYLALRTRHVTRGWLIPLASGAACVAFAVLTLVFPGLSLEITLMLVAAWLILYAGLTTALALALWPMPRTRRTLLAWTALNIVLAVLAVVLPNTTIFTLLYVGAGYAVALGALHMASGLWLHRVVVPRAAPTVQSTWPAAHSGKGR